jgi:hypothetical protein
MGSQERQGSKNTGYEEKNGSLVPFFSSKGPKTAHLRGQSERPDHAAPDNNRAGTAQEPQRVRPD